MVNIFTKKAIVSRNTDGSLKQVKGYVCNIASDMLVYNIGRFPILDGSVLFKGSTVYTMTDGEWVLNKQKIDSKSNLYEKIFFTDEYYKHIMGI